MIGARLTFRIFAQLAADARHDHPALTAVRHTRYLVYILFAAAMLYLLLLQAAYGADVVVGGSHGRFTLFDSLEEDAHTQSRTWFDVIRGLVRPTFLILATIEICWAAAIWAFEKDSLNSLAVEIIKKIMFIGFFYSLLEYAPDWIPRIADTFEFVGETAAQTGRITTDRIVATGLAVVNFIWDHKPTITIGNWPSLVPKYILAALVSLGIIICYVILATQYFFLKVESYLLFAAGAIFLGLGSTTWTKEYVSKYLNYAINVGVRLLVLILVVSLMLNTVNGMLQQWTFDPGPLLKMLAIAILQAIMGVRAPEMAGALMNGGVGLSAGTAMAAARSGVAAPVSSAAGVLSRGAGILGRAAGEISRVSGARALGGALGKVVGKSDGKGVTITLGGLGGLTPGGGGGAGGGKPGGSSGGSSAPAASAGTDRPQQSRPSGMDGRASSRLSGEAAAVGDGRASMAGDRTGLDGRDSAAQVRRASGDGRDSVAADHGNDGRDSIAGERDTASGSSAASRQSSIGSVDSPLSETSAAGAPTSRAPERANTADSEVSWQSSVGEHSQRTSGLSTLSSLRKATAPTPKKT